MQVVYPVADLVVPIENCPWPVPLKVPASRSTLPTAFAPGAVQDAPAVPANNTVAATVAGPKPAQTTEDQLIKLITNTVAAGSWRDAGGSGTVEYHAQGMALVVSQTHDVQEEIADLLVALRRLQDVEVAVEVRLVSLSDTFIERAAMNHPDLPGLADGFAKPTFFKDSQVAQFLEAVQEDRHTNVLQAPKVTVFNGQTANITVQDQQFFLTGVEMKKKADGKDVYLPKIEPITTGFSWVVQPVVSADRRFVRLKLNANLASLASPNVPLIPVQLPVPTCLKGTQVGTPAVLTMFLQQPALNTRELETTVNVADGATVVLGGWRVLSESRTEMDPPVLSKVPYLDRLFTNQAYGREAQNVVLLVTPRIIIDEEEEQVFLGNLPPIPSCHDEEARSAVAPCPAQAQPACHPPAFCPPATPPVTVLDNLKKLEDARKAFARAEAALRAGRTQRAIHTFERIEQLCPGSNVGATARARLEELRAVATEDVAAEEQESTGPTPQDTHCEELARLLKQYQKARCRRCRLAEARRLGAPGRCGLIRRALASEDAAGRFIVSRAVGTGAKR